MNPFDWAAGPFLTLYLALLAEVVFAGFLIPHWSRPRGRSTAGLTAEEAAWLGGGAPRYTDTVTAGLLAREALAMFGRDRFAIVPGAQSASPAEQRLLAAREPLHWGELASLLKPFARDTRDRLRRAGLLMSADELASLRFWATLPYAALIAFGATRLILGEARDRPIGFLTGLLILTLILGVIRWFSVDQRTRAGQALLQDEQRRQERLRRAPTSGEIGLAVALFGTGVLAGSAYDDFHQLRAGSDGGSSGGGDTSSGDSGCGGGGCGGCS